MATRRSGTTDFDSFEVGDQVRHPKWGVGSILFKSGSGEKTKAIVVFPEEGQKKLLLKYAKLERVQDARDADEDEFGIEETPPEPEAMAKEPDGEEEEEVDLEEEDDDLEEVDDLEDEDEK